MTISALFEFVCMAYFAAKSFGTDGAAPSGGDDPSWRSRNAFNSLNVDGSSTVNPNSPQCFAGYNRQPHGLKRGRGEHVEPNGPNSSPTVFGTPEQAQPIPSPDSQPRPTVNKRFLRNLLLNQRTANEYRERDQAATPIHNKRPCTPSLERVFFPVTPPSPLGSPQVIATSTPKRSRGRYPSRRPLSKGPRPGPVTPSIKENDPYSDDYPHRARKRHQADLGAASGSTLNRF